MWLWRCWWSVSSANEHAAWCAEATSKDGVRLCLNGRVIIHINLAAARTVQVERQSEHGVTVGVGACSGIVYESTVTEEALRRGAWRFPMWLGRSKSTQPSIVIGVDGLGSPVLLLRSIPQHPQQ